MKINKRLKINDFLSPMIKFYIVGGTGTIVNLGVLYILTEFFNAWYMFSAIAAIAISVTTNFLGNKFWTFKDRLHIKKSLFLQYRNFWVVSIISIIIQLALIYTLVQYFNVWYVLSAFLAITIASLGKFILSKLWVF